MVKSLTNVVPHNHALWGSCPVTWQAMELYLSPLVACIDSQSPLYVVWRCHPCRADDLPVDGCQNAEQRYLSVRNRDTFVRS